MKLTKEKILALNPCHIGLVFAESCNFDAVKIWNTCPRGDWMIWLLRRTNTITKPQSVTVAVMCAEHVLDIFEKKYPGDKRPRQAIDVAKTWLANPTEENRQACRSAYAAYAAYADAAYVAYAAAAADAGVAAAAAADAGDAAAYAAYAGDAAYAYAAYAGDAAYATYRIKERQWQADKIRELIPCPFENL